MNPKIAVVTGANKGIGFAISKELLNRGIHVVMTARDETRGRESLAQMGKQNVEFYQLDITSQDSVDKFARYLKEKYKGIDILVNNAGMAFKEDAFDEDVARITLETNYFGTLRACQNLIPLINDGGRIVNVSSTAGKPSKLSEHLRTKITSSNLTIEELNSLMNKFIEDVSKKTWKKEGWPNTTYGVSKIGVTAMTRVFARQNGNRILINACCPGWIRTDMTSNNPAAGKPEDGARVPVWLATETKDNGGFFTIIGKETKWENF